MQMHSHACQGSQLMASIPGWDMHCRADALRSAAHIVLTGQSHLRSRPTTCKAATAQAEEASSSDASDQEPEYYEVSLPKPLGVQLSRGKDGAAYVTKSSSDIGNTDGQIEVGDKVVNISASFGSDVWKATNYGQVLYAIKTRSGEVYMRFQKMYGDTSALQAEDTPEDEKQWKSERRGGNYGAGTQVMQAQNYAKKKADEVDRKKLFEEALGKFRSSDIEGALVDFENVISTEPRGFRGDDGTRFTQVYRVAQYNIACCYSTIGQAEAGLEALSKCLQAGFEGFSKIRADPNLEKVRADPGFQPLIEEYDEPVISGEAIKAIKNFFSFGRK